MDTILTQKNKCMIDIDFHTHTGFSDDCDCTVEEMLEGAAARGIKILAVTDHFDPGYPDPEFPFTIDFHEYQETMSAAREKYRGTMEILTGLEVGIMEGQFDAANSVINAYPYDFIIGSFHCHRGNDLYTFDYTDVDGPAMLEDFYTYMYDCLKAFDNYDIVGHFSILDRYIGKLYDYSPFEDVIDEILKLLVQSGKGIEINTSSFKYGTGTWLPRESILRRYKELGGEILTFGSDAHNPEHYQLHFNDAVEFARELGFRYHCIFRKRKPEFLPL
ncbi:MAG: histidinol-phosphatase HisJ family protein [Bacillota bacterium]|nr:histidinol-phosphatase HisJ family protein [Bacillota bacterium]